ncbi:OmpA family protein [Sphingomonas sp.]|uniref:OmpA family protein n=1 Tax=Sphingomonas sp. TaxID=28214 RepID=UPI001B0145FD|nr:OmpA family protein [Sphingomonas sp.]MBO9713821.1 OmpA family protein [Sphingomonas sp.]
MRFVINGVFFAIALSLAGVLLLSMRACSTAKTERRLAATENTTADIVDLPDGGTLMASKGTVTRSLVDWLKSDADTGNFELGGQEFVGRTAQPTPESLGRVPRLAAMLKAYPEVHLVVTGHASASGNAAADEALALERAKAAAKLIEGSGIPAERIRFEGQGSAAPLAGTKPEDPRNERVSLMLTRG